MINATKTIFILQFLSWVVLVCRPIYYEVRRCLESIHNCKSIHKLRIYSLNSTPPPQPPTTPTTRTSYICVGDNADFVNETLRKKLKWYIYIYISNIFVEEYASENVACKFPTQMPWRYALNIHAHKSCILSRQFCMLMSQCETRKSCNLVAR